MYHWMHPFDHKASPLLAGVFLSLLWLQWRQPLRHQHFSSVQRMITNIVFALPAFAALRLVLIPIPLYAAWGATQHHVGLLHWLTLPPLLAAVAGIMTFDYAYYWWHIATHNVPLLWRFHNVHHTDLDMDVSTATRFHFCELLLSVAFRVAVVLLTGITPWALLAFEVCFECAGQFHHSNWCLPVRVERALNLVIVTPRMHGIHHSIVLDETNSNWGTIFSWWDKLHHTLRRDIAQADITIGVPAYRDEKELTVGQLFLLPFRPQRDWKLPDGETPKRAS
ncbi:MAG: sterol desaturase family protein [Abitibacteriaceae bacterium]|nr:sterol desaturase family protein [Abditibacteriaceae bacterium]